MMTVTPEQMAALNQDVEARFVAEVAQDLREQSAEQVAGHSDEELRQVVRHGFARARARGFTTADGLAGWVSLMIDTAPNFDEHPAVRRVLADRTIPDEGDRLDALFERLSEQDWQAVLDAHDDGAWSNV